MLQSYKVKSKKVTCFVLGLQASAIYRSDATARHLQRRLVKEPEQQMYNW